MSSTSKIIIIDEKNNEVDSFYCKMCNFPLITHSDFSNNEEYGCCNDCYLNFVESRRDEWKSGWRPKQNLIDSYIKQKNNIFKNTGEESEF